MTETQSSQNVSTKLERIAKLARDKPGGSLLTLAHHVAVDWLREAYRPLTLARNDPGVLVRNDPLTRSAVTVGRLVMVTVASAGHVVGDGCGRCAQEASMFGVPTMVPA